MHVCFNMTVPLRFAGSLRVDMCTLPTFGCTVGFVGLVEYKTNEPLFGVSFKHLPYTKCAEDSTVNSFV